MEALLDFLLTITGVRLILEGLAVGVLALGGLATVLVSASTIRGDPPRGLERSRRRSIGA